MSEKSADDSEHSEAWELRELGPAAGFVAAAIWLAALFAPDAWSTRLSNAGQAVGFVAGAVAVYAVVIALRQLSLQRISVEEQVKEQAVASAQRHQDAERAHMDKLADAYTAWFAKVLPVLALMLDPLRTAWSRGGPSEARGALNLAYGQERQLRLAAIPLLMLERRPNFRSRVEKTFVSLPSWEAPVPESEIPRYREHVDRVIALLLERRDEVDSLFSDVATAVRASPS